ncbi:hypothetical protein F5Y17DRAFT_428010 [Xylariaceae sp. FL0594]|nr:hypothetical protein F5Y17DRAFT_428010 [Xylariaceae sp. FL0594]
MSQPPVNAAYQAESNAVTRNPAEEAQSRSHSSSPSSPVAHRGPEDSQRPITEAVPKAPGYGTHGAPAGEEKHGRTREDVGRHNELEGEQMRMPGEGKVADAVERKPGASGAEPDLASDLDRKKAEQAGARQAVKEARKHGLVDDGAPMGGVDVELDKNF